MWFQNMYMYNLLTTEIIRYSHRLLHFSVACDLWSFLYSYYRSHWQRQISSIMYQWKTWHLTSLLWQKSSVIAVQMLWVTLKCSTCMIQGALNQLKSKTGFFLFGCLMSLLHVNVVVNIWLPARQQSSLCSRCIKGVDKEENSRRKWFPTPPPSPLYMLRTCT